jgi:hypothetical protein
MPRASVVSNCLELFEHGEMNIGKDLVVLSLQLCERSADGKGIRKTAEKGAEHIRIKRRAIPIPMSMYFEKGGHH